jgi:hypothetical protein
MNQWISASFVLIGVIVGGILSYFASLHKTSIENEWKRDESLLKKFEELYITAEDVKEGFLDSGTRGIAKAHFGTPIPESRKIPITKLKALIDFYAPEAQAIFKRLEQKREIFGNHYAKALTTSAFTKTEAQQLSKLLLDSSMDIDSVCTEIQECILNASRSLRVARPK